MKHFYSIFFLTVKRCAILIFIWTCCLLPTGDFWAQAPYGFNYQAVIRDANGDMMANANVTMKFTITAGIFTTIKYQETQALQTNEFGLLDCVIGFGTVLQGNITTVDWDAGNRFLKVEIDTGSGFVNMGFQQMVSVPYALSALDAVNSWGTTGNEGTDPEVNFIGTTDEQPLKFRMNNENAGRIDTLNTSLGYKAYNGTGSYYNVAIGRDALRSGGNHSVAVGHGAARDGSSYNNYGDVMIGYNAGHQNYWGAYNVFIGLEAGYNNGSDYYGGYRNVFIGHQAGYSNVGKQYYDGNDNTFVGYQSGYSNGADYGGASNTFMGSYSGSDNTVGSSNSFLGTYAGGDNTTGDDNTFIGYYAGHDNTTDSYNTFIGSRSGINNSGAANTFLGYGSGYNNIAGYFNIFLGKDAGYENISGYENTFVGNDSGIENTTGRDNTFLGYQSGQNNSTGLENTFVGKGAGLNNSSADHNTALGFDAGGNQTTGGDCTFIGYSAEGSTGTITNSTAIGYQASVIGSNHVRIGNTSITQIGGQVAWSNLSDARLKKNIAPSTLGLDFIKKLKPVTYNFIEGHEGILYTGFLAQDVEKTLNELGQDFSGIAKPENETDFYSIRYSEFVMPLVNAVQELNGKIEQLEKENDELKLLTTRNETAKTLAAQQKLIEALEKKIHMLEKEFRVNN